MLPTKPENSNLLKVLDAAQPLPTRLPNLKDISDLDKALDNLIAIGKTLIALIIN
jgi:hypothetical protein